MAINPLLSSSSSYDANINRLNSVIQNFNNEQNTKAFSGIGGKNMIVQGRLPSGKYGHVYYDPDGTARIYIGQHPVDGHMGVWISKDGTDVITELGG